MRTKTLWSHKLLLVYSSIPRQCRPIILILIVEHIVMPANLAVGYPPHSHNQSPPGQQKWTCLKNEELDVYVTGTDATFNSHQNRSRVTGHGRATISYQSRRRVTSDLKQAMAQTFRKQANIVNNCKIIYKSLPTYSTGQKQLQQIHHNFPCVLLGGLV